MSARARRWKSRLIFECPGCECSHAPNVESEQYAGGPWQWNGSLERPTLYPSVLVRWTRRAEGEAPVDVVCHSFVVDGRIQFLGDCTHALAGQTVDLPDLDDAEDSTSGLEARR